MKKIILFTVMLLSAILLVVGPQVEITKQDHSLVTDNVAETLSVPESVSSHLLANEHIMVEEQVLPKPELVRPLHPATVWLPEPLRKYDETIVSYLLDEGRIQGLRSLEKMETSPQRELEPISEDRPITISALREALAKMDGSERVLVSWPETFEGRPQLVIETAVDGLLPTAQELRDTIEGYDPETTVAAGPKGYLEKSSDELSRDRHALVQRAQVLYKELESQVVSEEEKVQEAFRTQLGKDYSLYVACRNTPEFGRYIAARRSGD